MTVPIEDLMDECNADDDEKGKLITILAHAKSLVDLQIDGNNENLKYKNPNQIQDIKDRVVLQTAVNFYKHPDGASKASFNNMTSIDSLKNYVRTPSVG